jgi:thiol-disulfide isomerase/thioredoxin
MKLLPKLRLLSLLALLFLIGCQDQKKPVKPAAPQGTIVVYSATWCRPCQEARPKLRELVKANIRVQVVDCSDGAPSHIKTVPHYVVYDAHGNKLGEAGSISALILLLKALGWIIPLFL